MRCVLYNPRPEDLASLKDVPEEAVLIIDLWDRYSSEGGVGFIDFKTSNKMFTQLWLQKWSYKKINGKTIKEIFSYKKQTFFYLLSYFFQRTFMRESFFFKDRVGLNVTFCLIDLLDDFIKKGDVISVVSYDPYTNHFMSIVRKVCEKKKVRLNIVKDEDLRVNKYDFIRRNPEILKYLIKARIFFRYLISLFRSLIIPVYKGGKKVLFLSSLRFSRYDDEDNVLFGTITKKLLEEHISYKIINYDSPDIKYAFSVLRNFMFHPTTYVGDYYSPKIFRDNKRLVELFKKKWLIIRGHDELRKTFFYKDINFYDLVEPLFDFIFDNVFYLVADNFNITKRILEKEKPKVFVLDHEENFYGKGLLMNAKKIKSVALQHEAVLANDTNHAHIKDNKSLEKKSVFWRPLPTKKCASGPYSKNVLLKKCNYPEDRIVVTGHPKFDLLIEEYDRDELRKKYNINPSKKVVLYAVECAGITKIFYEVAKKMKSVTFIIKPHPETDMKRMKQVHKNNEKKNILLMPANANIYELLSLSDLLVSYDCTVMMESLIKGVPVLSFNPLKEADAWGYVGIPETYTIRETIDKIRSMLKKPFVISDKTKRYLYKHNYKLDGRATERVVEVIKDELC